MNIQNNVGKRNKLTFLIFLLRLFKKESLGTKIYLCFRIIIFPMNFLTKITQNIKNDDHILDLGCGYGIISFYLNFFGFKNRILGLDIDKERIKKLQQIVQKYDFNEYDFEVRDFIKQGFDSLHGYNIAILVDILHHLDKSTQEMLLKKLSENINTIIIKDIDIIPRYKYYRNWFHDRILMQNKILCFQGSLAIHEYLVSLGYNVIYERIPSIFPYPHFLLVAKK